MRIYSCKVYVARCVRAQKLGVKPICEDFARAEFIRTEFIRAKLIRAIFMCVKFIRAKFMCEVFSCGIIHAEFIRVNGRAQNLFVRVDSHGIYSCEMYSHGFYVGEIYSCEFCACGI